MFDRLLPGFPNLILLLLLGIVTLLFGYMLKPFFFSIFWAVLLAGVFAPLNGLLRQKLKSPNLCAVLTLGAVLVSLILPIGLVLVLLAGESLEIYKSINSNSSSWMNSLTSMFNSLSQYPLLARFDLDQQFITGKAIELLKAVANFLVNNLSAFTENTILFIVQFAVMLYCLFYFLLDGDRFINSIAQYMPVNERRLNSFISDFFVTSKATLKSAFVIGGIQGLLGVLIFYITGIENPLVWGVLMIGFSIIPGIGSSIIWAPAGIIMLFSGYIWQGITILVFGAVVISSVDNLLRPVLLGKDIQMHPLLIFLSILGGIAAFGFSGFVLGPVIASFFLSSWKLLLELSLEGKTQK